MGKGLYFDKAQKTLAAISPVVKSKNKPQQHHKYFVYPIYKKSGPLGRVKQLLT